ncbi:MAG TPA: HupE/UreJ family protein [Blastocatellia bacterium]|nr:HupE/UreJ family protein [Blastocatellia bacterium]
MNPTRIHHLIASLGLALGLCLLATVSVFAHDPGLSLLELKIDEGSLTAQITFARQELATLVPLDSDRDGTITQAELDAARPQLETLAREALIIELDGRPLAPAETSASLGETDAIHLNLKFPAAIGERLKLSSPLIARLARGHRQFLTIRNEGGDAVSQVLLDANNQSFEIARSALTARGTQIFGRFLQLGVEHILLGFDHLAFLCALLIAGSTFREAAKIITSFTAAHSITLAVATLDLVRIPSNIVEPMIAVSIIYVSLENIFRRNRQGRWLLTFAFGLIHGFGFAYVLRELGVGTQGGGVALPLVSFNLGVELGQLAIAALVLPLIWKLHQRSTFATRYVPVGSALIALAGGYWLVQRTLLSN